MMKINYDEITMNDDETYDIIVLNTASKRLGGMKGWEFEPSVEEIMDYQWDMAILSDVV